jgi:hypothetical protein
MTGGIASAPTGSAEEDSAERQVLLRDLLVEIEDRQDHWDADDAE